MLELREELSEYSDVPMFPFSAVTGEGAEEIKAYIEKRVEETQNKISKDV